MTTPDAAIRATLLLAVLALAGCKGEGGTASLPDLVDPRGAPEWVSTSPPPPDALSRSFAADWDAVFDAARALAGEARYSVQRQSWYLTNEAGRPISPTYLSDPIRSSGIHIAHAAGLTGQGSLVAVVDGGFRMTHETISGRAISFGDITGLNIFDADGSPIGPDHGTSVASVLAGFSDSMVGTAPGASLLLLSYGADSNFHSLTSGAILAQDSGAVALNNSWGYPNQDWRGNAITLEQSYDDFFSGSFAPGGEYLAALRDYARDGVVVFAASNTATASQSTIMDALPLFHPELEAGWIATINGVPTLNVAGDNVVNARRISAACLDSARWCMAADGTWFTATGSGDADYEQVATGASFAAPMVSGALALLSEAFPDLPPHALRARLIATADNDFTGFGQRIEMEVMAGSGVTHAYSREWGHGFLDIAAALQPIGTPMLTMADGEAVAADRPLVLAGGAAGAVALSPEIRAYAVDALGGGFETPVSSLVATPDRPVDLRLSEPGVLGEWGGAAAVELGSVQVATLTDADAAGLSVAARLPAGDGALSLGVTAAQDDGSLMPHGAGADGARLASLDLGWESWDPDGTSLRLGASFGVTGTPGLDGGTASFSALSVAASRADVLARGDRLTLSLAAPVALTSGEVSLNLPVARSATGPVAASATPYTYRDTVLDLAPDSREIDLGLRYSAPLDAGGEVWVDAVHAFNHGHVEGADALAVGIGWRVGF